MAFQSLSTSYRLLNPSDAISNPPSSDASAFNTYFDAALTSFFNNYLAAGQTFRLQRDGYYFVGQTKQNFSPPSVSGTYTVLQLQQTDSDWNVISGGQTYQIYAPYFSNGSAYPPNFPESTPLAAAPPWIAPASAGEMVFGNLGAFADGAAQASDGQISGTGATGQILLDIENTIVSAFNRGVANSVAPGNDVTSAWDNNATYYPSPNATGSNWSNFYAGFLHNDGVSITAPGSKVGLAYGFAYDDQGGNDPTLTSFAAKVAITLNALVAEPLGAAKLHFAAAPKGIKLAPRTDLLALSLKGALPRTNYTVVVFEHSKGGDKTVGSPVTIKSNARGRLRSSVRTPIRLRPGVYRVLVQDLQDTDSAAVSRWFRVR